MVGPAIPALVLLPILVVLVLSFSMSVGWLSRGDLALESTAHFLAFAEHRLVPARARTVTTQLRQARRSSVWAPSCQDVTPCGHAGVGVISLHGAPLSLPFSIPLFQGVLSCWSCYEGYPAFG